METLAAPFLCSPLYWFLFSAMNLGRDLGLHQERRGRKMYPRLTSNRRIKSEWETDDDPVTQTQMAFVHLNGFSRLRPAPGGSAARFWFLCSVSSFHLFPPFSWLSPGGSPVAICVHYFKHCQAGSSPEVFSSCPLCLSLLDPMQNSVGGPNIWYCSWVFKNTLRPHMPVDFNVLESKTGL